MINNENYFQLNIRPFEKEKPLFANIPTISQSTLSLFSKKSSIQKFYRNIEKIGPLCESLEIAKANETEDIFFGVIRSVLVTAVIAFILFAAVYMIDFVAVAIGLVVLAYLFSLLVTGGYAYIAKDLLDSAAILPFLCIFLAPLLPFFEAYNRVSSLQSDTEETIDDLLNDRILILFELEEVKGDYLEPLKEEDLEELEEIERLLEFFKKEKLEPIQENSDNSSSSD